MAPWGCYGLQRPLRLRVSRPWRHRSAFERPAFDGHESRRNLTASRLSEKRSFTRLKTATSPPAATCQRTADVITIGSIVPKLLSRRLEGIAPPDFSGVGAAIFLPLLPNRRASCSEGGKPLAAFRLGGVHA